MQCHLCGTGRRPAHHDSPCGAVYRPFIDADLPKILGERRPELRCITDPDDYLRPLVLQRAIAAGPGEAEAPELGALRCFRTAVRPETGEAHAPLEPSDRTS